MSAEAVGEWSGHPLPAGLALVRHGLDLLLGASAWSLTDAEVRAAIVELTAQAGRVEAARAVLVREAVSREVPDARGCQGARTVNLLKSRCRVAPARAAADVANAKATCPDTGPLRGLGAALAEGQVSREHVDVARACLRRLPARVVRDRGNEVDRLLTEHARAWDPGTAETLARHLLAVLAPDRSDRYDEHALERRHLGVTADSTGMVLVRGQLDPAGGLMFTTVLDHLVAQDRANGSSGGDGSSGEGPGATLDLRTRGQRRRCHRAAKPTQPTEPTEPTAPTGPTVRQRAVRAVPRVVVVTTPEQLAGAPGAGAATATDGSLVNHGTLTRLACDAVIDRVVIGPHGRVVAMDTLGRLASPAQQHALAARDRGCTWPGCTTAPSPCEAHHVIWWSRGGPTTIDNLALLCHRHHTQIHTEPDHPDRHGWQMLIRDGIPWFRPPDHHDRSGTLRRNTFHQSVDATRRTGRRWNAPEPDPP